MNEIRINGKDVEWPELIESVTVSYDVWIGERSPDERGTLTLNCTTEGLIADVWTEGEDESIGSYAIMADDIAQEWCLGNRATSPHGQQVALTPDDVHTIQVMGERQQDGQLMFAQRRLDDWPPQIEIAGQLYDLETVDAGESTELADYRRRGRAGSPPAGVLDCRGCPATPAELRAAMDENGCVTGWITICPYELVDLDLEGLLDLISERLAAGSPLLMDSNYTFKHLDVRGQLITQVRGDVTQVLEVEDPDHEG